MHVSVYPVVLSSSLVLICTSTISFVFLSLSFSLNVLLPMRHMHMQDAHIRAARWPGSEEVQTTESFRRIDSFRPRFRFSLLSFLVSPLLISLLSYSCLLYFFLPLYCLRSTARVPPQQHVLCHPIKFVFRTLMILLVLSWSFIVLLPCWAFMSVGLTKNRNQRRKGNRQKDKRIKNKD